MDFEDIPVRVPCLVYASCGAQLAWHEGWRVEVDARPRCLACGNVGVRRLCNECVNMGIEVGADGAPVVPAFAGTEWAADAHEDRRRQLAEWREFLRLAKKFKVSV